MMVTRKTIYDFGKIEFTIEDSPYSDYDTLRVSGGLFIDGRRDVVGDGVSDVRGLINDIMMACNDALTELDRSVVNDR